MDWSYCMWECGLANASQDPDPKIYVFQCGRDVPSPFADMVRIDARNKNDIRRFTNIFLLQRDFIPGQAEPVAPGFNERDSDKAADEFFENLAAVLPSDVDEVEEWRAWPYLRVELSGAEAKRLEQTDVDDTAKFATVKERGVIADSNPRALQLFGRASFPPNLPLKKLFELWKASSPHADDDWFESLCVQVMVGAQRGIPVIRSAPLQEAGGDSEFTPVLSRIKHLPFADKLQFDVYFYDLANPSGVPVTSKMLRKFFYIDLGAGAPETVKLTTLTDEIERRGYHRIPVLDGKRHPVYMIHSSMIEKFLLKRLLSKSGGKAPDELTLADLLDDPVMKRVFETTFAVVGERATLAAAKEAMSKIEDCRDVFVTPGGGRDEPVLGLLTNVDMTGDS
jgi:hypothetical protein